MPLTWFAHQAPVIPLKMARPAWFDATALCVGSMMPDLMTSFATYVHVNTHHWGPALGFGVPLTIIATIVTRFVVAPVGALQLPDFGRFRVHSYGVLAARHPAFVVTLISALLGVASHISLDAFTHPHRSAVKWLHYDDVSFHLAGRIASLAGIFQAVGHVVGSAIAIWLLWRIGTRRLLEQWYSPAAVERARAQVPSARERRRFRAVTAVGGIAGLAWGWHGTYIEHLQRFVIGLFVGTVAGSMAVTHERRASPRRSP